VVYFEHVQNRRTSVKLVIAGGTGQIGQILIRALTAKGNDVCVISRSPANGVGSVKWDGRTLGGWKNEIDGSDVVINLAGRSVNCRYSDKNLQEMMSSRVDSTRVIGQAIAQSKRPPAVWLQMSTATIYAHSFDKANDEETGIIGGQEPDVPRYWGYSIEIAKAWEQELFDAATPHTRKVALRSAMVMSPDRGGIFDVLFKLVRAGLGGPVGGGKQFVSWIHERDFVRAVEFLISKSEISDVVNLASPNPIPQRKFMAVLRSLVGTPIGLPATRWMAEIGAFFFRTDTELLLKSRKVVPTRLLNAGFQFEYSDWAAAAQSLVESRQAASVPKANAG
jgi:uncharacterized protein (TIGR01777 family)